MIHCFVARVPHHLGIAIPAHDVWKHRIASVLGERAAAIRAVGDALHCVYGCPFDSGLVPPAAV